MKSVLFPSSVFSIFIFLYSVLMVQLYFIKSKSLSNELSFTVLSVPNSIFQYFLDSILMVPLNCNNQKHLQLIDFIYIYIYIYI